MSGKYAKNHKSRSCEPNLIAKFIHHRNNIIRSISDDFFHEQTKKNAAREYQKIIFKY